MSTLDEIVAGTKDKTKQQLQEALLELLKGNPDILDPIMKSTTRTNSEVVSVFFFNPLSPKSAFIDFTLSNARRFYLSRGDPLGLKGLKNSLP